MPPSDPPRACLIEVEVDRIDFCDLNPRRQENAAYERIRESIRQSGLDQPITITRRPGQELYVVAAGGNTRLKIFQELSGSDARFSKIPCVFKPWVSEIELLAAHLRENDLRDDLVFIDHAVAIHNLRRLLDAQAGGSLTNTAYYEDTGASIRMIDACIRSLEIQGCRPLNEPPKITVNVTEEAQKHG
jgi:ParB family protein of integrating conjugative element (PFGI_1 class)